MNGRRILVRNDATRRGPSGVPANSRAARTPRAKFAGFTLVELVITLSIAAILITLALPSMRTLILTQYVRTGASDLHSALYFARSEALKRAANVSVVPTSADWRNGWDVKLPDDTVLRRQTALNTNVAAIAGSAITYRSDGHLTTAPGTMVVKLASDAGVAARCVTVDLSGRPSLTTDTDGNPGNGCN